MKTQSLFLIFVISFFGVFGQTTIQNGEKVFGTWTKSKSPYIIEGEAVVPNGKTLVIKPGVEIRFKTGENRFVYDEDGQRNFGCDIGYLRVEGTLIAKGKKNKPIIFTKNGKFGKWGNVHFVNSTDNILEYCNFDYAYYMRLVTPDDNATGAISFLNSTGTVKNCIIRRAWSGINAKQGASPVIENCTIIDNSYGVESNSESRPKVVNCIIWHNNQAFYVNPGASINVTYSLIETDELPAEVYSSHNILNKNPLLKPDFSLKKNSPCKKAGKKGVDIGVLK